MTKISLAAVALGVTAWTAQAATISYGDRPGNTVSFEDISESSTTDPVPLYGDPDSDGSDDQITFEPKLFASSASNGSADITEGLLNFVVQADEGYWITDVHFNEFGDYTLVGVGTPATEARVGQSIFVEVLEIDGVELASPIVLSMNSIFNPSNGDYQLPVEAGVAQPWFGVGSLDVSAGLARQGVSGNATRIEVTSDNILTTTSETGTLAHIQKKDLNIDIDTEIPEPASLSLLALGAGFFLRRRS